MNASQTPKDYQSALSLRDTLQAIFLIKNAMEVFFNYLYIPMTNKR